MSICGSHTPPLPAASSPRGALDHRHQRKRCTPQQAHDEQIFSLSGAHGVQRGLMSFGFRAKPTSRRTVLRAEPPTGVDIGLGVRPLPLAQTGTFHTTTLLWARQRSTRRRGREQKQELKAASRNEGSAGGLRTNFGSLTRGHVPAKLSSSMVPMRECLVEFRSNGCVFVGVPSLRRFFSGVCGSAVPG